MRAAAALMLALGGCGSAPDVGATPGQTIACGPVGAALANDCTLERTGRSLLVRRPDGGFRRLTLTEAGVESADGAEELDVHRRSDALMATVDGWTYAVGNPSE